MFSSSFIRICLVFGVTLIACQAGRQEAESKSEAESRPKERSSRPTAYYPPKLAKICRNILKPAQPYLKKKERDKLARALAELKTTRAPRDEKYVCNKPGGKGSKRLRRSTNADGCCTQTCDLYVNMTTATNYMGANVTIHQAHGQTQCFHQCSCEEIPLCGADPTQQCKCHQEWRFVYAQVHDIDDHANIIRDYVLVPSCCRSVVTVTV